MVRNLWVTFIKKPYMKLLDGGVSLGDTIRTNKNNNNNNKPLPWRT
jgi:hypothetical protein